MDTQEKLRSLVGDAFPHLSFMQEVEIPSVDRVMRELFECAQSAITNQDVDRFVKCFRLFEELSKLEEERNQSVDRALNFEFLVKWDRHGKMALEMLRELPTHVRETLRHPFSYPHTWLRECQIVLAVPDEAAKKVTVMKPSTAVGRHIKQFSALGAYAVVEIQVEPSSTSSAVVFKNLLSEEDPCPLIYIERVVEGVKLGLSKAVDETQQVSNVCVNLLNLKFHDVDSRMIDFEIAAMMAVQQCIDAATLVTVP